MSLSNSIFIIRVLPGFLFFVRGRRDKNYFRCEILKISKTKICAKGIQDVDIPRY